MPSKKITNKRKTVEREETRSNSTKNQSFFDRIQGDLRDNQSFLNLILGTLVVLVIGVLLFNFFTKRGDNNLGPAQQTENTQTEQTADVSKESLPGKYTVKEGDTLFTIAQNYYDDGFKYTNLVAANKIADENTLEVGQVLDIPKLEEVAAASTEASPAPEASPSELAQATPSPSPAATQAPPGNLGTGGAENQTIWGERITADTYTVQEGDWLSKISGRSYGDIMQYQKLAQANNIQNPDVIEPGTVLKIPR